MKDPRTIPTLQRPLKRPQGAPRPPKAGFIPAPHLQIIEGEESFGFSPLFLDVLDTIAPRLFRIHDDGVHVLPQDLRHGDLIFLLRWLAQVDEAAVL